jgi:16S rRNA processing protein RimM
VAERCEKRVILGRISGVYGVKGWVKVHSFTEPRENIVGFDHWILEHGARPERVELEAGRSQGKHIGAKLRGIDDRDAAGRLVGADISVARGALPTCGPGEYYWTDLEGLAVHSVEGEPLGVVDHLIETGAHDVLVLAGDGERLIPFVVPDVVRRVDLDAGVIVVDWDFGTQ